MSDEKNIDCGTIIKVMFHDISHTINGVPKTKLFFSKIRFKTCTVETRVDNL